MNADTGDSRNDSRIVDAMRDRDDVVVDPFIMMSSSSRVYVLCLLFALILVWERYSTLALISKYDL